MSNVRETLDERGQRYGSFKGHAEVSQKLKNVMYEELAKRNKDLSYSQYEAIEMIFHKLGRIVNGDANYIDSWRDIVGYTQLVVDELLVTDGSTDVTTVKMEVVDGVLSVKTDKALPESTITYTANIPMFQTGVMFGDRGNRDGY